MNLRSIANSYTRVINPNVVATLNRSNGYLTLDSGRRVPQFTQTPIIIQMQALSFGDIQSIEGLNIQGYRRKIYTNSFVAGLIRVGQKGGDLIVFDPATPGAPPEGNTWLCAHVLEPWGPWRAFVMTLQNNITSSEQGPSLDFSDAGNSQYLPGTT